MIYRLKTSAQTTKNSNNYQISDLEKAKSMMQRKPIVKNAILLFCLLVTIMSLSIRGRLRMSRRPIQPLFSMK